MDDMENDDNADMSAMMGFSGFGNPNASNKRKYRHDDAFVDRSAIPAKVKEPVSHGANTIPLGLRKQPIKVEDIIGPMSAPDSQGSAQRRAEVMPDDWRLGVKQENGDIAYFLPSFLEDPWEKLRSSRP